MRALLLLPVLATVVRAEETGSVCLLKASWEDPKGARASEQPPARPVKTFTVQVDDLAPLDVTASAQRVDGLALGGKHRMRVFADGKPLEGFSFTFARGPRLTLRHHAFYASWSLDVSQRECP